MVPAPQVMAAGPWVAKSQMPTSRLSSNSAVVNGKIWVFGGSTSPYPNPPAHMTNIVEMYDPSTDTWTTEPSLPTPLFIAGDFVLGDFVILVSGAIPGSTSNQVLAYNTTNGQCMQIGTVNHSGLRTDADIIGTKAYFVTAGSPIQELNTSDGSCTDKISLPEYRDWPVVTAANSKLYIIGGYDSGGTPVKTCWEYDPVTNTVATKSPMPIARGGKQSFVKDGKIYIIGGSITPGPPPITAIDDIQVYNPATDSWSVSDMPKPSARWGAVTEVVGDSVYMIGGTDNTNVFNVNEMCSLTSSGQSSNSTTVSFNVLSTVTVTGNSIDFGSVTAGVNNLGDRTLANVQSNCNWQLLIAYDPYFTRNDGAQIPLGNLTSGGNPLPTSVPGMPAPTSTPITCPNLNLNVPWTVVPSSNPFSAQATLTIVPAP
jgi:N-acetylneuraminic acid mutarotase